MIRLFAMLLVSCLAWTLGACGSPNTKTDGNGKTTSKVKTDQPKRTFVRPQTSEFIRDRKVKYVKQGGKTTAIDQGPLLGYQIRLNYALNPDKSSYREGRLAGQTIVFGIPDGKGDTGASFTLAFDRAAEMLARGDLPLSASQSERTVSGAIALVNVISLGYPSGRNKGDKIPVILEPLGNAKSIIGGHFYGTLLQDVGVSKTYNSKGKAEYATGKRLASAGYTQLWPEEVLTRETFFARKTFREIFDPEGTLEETTDAEKEEDKKRGITKRQFILKDAFRMMRSTTWQDNGRDEVILQLGWDRPEIVEGVYRSLMEAAKQSKKGFEFQVRRDPSDSTRIYIVPSVREGNMESFYDDIRSLFFEIRPQNQLDILLDNDQGRILVVGPQSRRRMIRSFDFGLKRQSIKDYQPTGQFRFIGTISGDKQFMDLTWSRRDGSKVVAEGSDRVRNDFGAILRYAYDKKMSVGDATVFVLESVERRNVNARLVRQQEVKRVRSSK